MRLRTGGLLVTLVLGILAAPLAADAQQPTKIYRIGVLFGGSSPTPSTPNFGLEAFRQRLRDLGYVEGKNLVIEYRWAENKLEPLPGLAAELVRLKMDIIVTTATTVAAAAKSVTTTVPIVMAVSADPVGSKVVDSLARPGGNITGLTLSTPDITGKRLELLREAAPRISRVAAVHPGPATFPVVAEWIRENEVAATALALKLKVVDIGRDPP